jgi:hypothetical protein
MAKDGELQDQDIRGLKYFRRLMPLLDRLHEVGTGRDRAGNRQLFFDNYAKLVLLYLFNPLIDSMRILQEASALGRVARALGIKRFSVGSFSEAPAVFDPEALRGVIAELAKELRPLSSDPRLRELKQVLTLADSTLLRVLPKLTETLYGRLRDGAAAHVWRLHTHLVLGEAVPELMVRTAPRGVGNTEIQHLAEHLQPGRCYVLDRGYLNAGLLNDIHAAGSSYVCRARENLAPQLIHQRPLSEASREAGVLSDALVRISVGSDCPSDHPLRLIEIAVEPHHKRTRRDKEGVALNVTVTRMLLLTDLLDEPPELIALIYRYRWTIELFFRMLKQLLGCRHLLSQRPAGIDIQLYCTVIAMMLIHLQTGTKPSKAKVFLLGLYLAGWATEQEVIDRLNRPDNTGVKQRAKDALWKKLGVN